MQILLCKKLKSLKDLTYKVTVMLMLLSGQRIQTIQLLDFKDMTMSKSQFTFKVSVKLNTLTLGGIYKIWNLRLMLPIDGYVFIPISKTI